jgi:hypothetical protein
MASSYLQAFPVPQTFYEILAELTRDILRDQPANILEYATLYFERREQPQPQQSSIKYFRG